MLLWLRWEVEKAFNAAWPTTVTPRGTFDGLITARRTIWPLGGMTLHKAQLIFVGDRPALR